MGPVPSRGPGFLKTVVFQKYWNHRRSDNLLPRTDGPRTLSPKLSEYDEHTDAIGSPKVNMLLLGSSDSGKSTWLKMMNVFERGSYTKAERRLFSEIIFSRIGESCRAVLDAMVYLGLPLESRAIEGHVRTIHEKAPYLLHSISPNLYSAVAALTNDRGFRMCLRRRNEYQLCDNMDFFFDSIDRISSAGYLPSDEDISYLSVRTTGVTETRFDIEDIPGQTFMDLRVRDVGGARSERKKWNHVFGDVDVILFTVDIGSYDQILREDETTNRMDEALWLFESVVNSESFSKTEFVLCFTKQAKLAAKLERFPLETFFPEFEADEPKDMTSAILFIERLFLSLSRTPKFIHTMVIPDLPSREDWHSIKEICWKIQGQKAAKQHAGKQHDVKL